MLLENYRQRLLKLKSQSMANHSNLQMSLPAWSISLERLKIRVNPTAVSSPYHALSRNASYLDG